MNKVLTGVLATITLAASSFSALAATQINSEQASDLQSAGTVSVSAVRGSLDDANHQLRMKAQEMGASHYRIIRMDNPGDSSLWSGNAEIYR